MAIEDSLWKQYEWLVAKIYHDERDFRVECNARVRGAVSGQARQVDILVTEVEDGVQRIVVVDCKKRSSKVDIKSVEEFIGLCEDIGADRGIIVSSAGFTEGARRRVRGRGNVILETIGWEKAYEKAKEAVIPSHITHICWKCTEPEELGRRVPGLILWEQGLGGDSAGLWCIFWVGRCLRCGAVHLYCDPCGTTTIITDGNFVCSLCGLDYSEAAPYCLP